MKFQDFHEHGPGILSSGTQADDALWFFHHIPKTAGTSLTQEFGQRNLEYRNICVREGRHHLPHDEEMDREVSAFLSAQDLPVIQIASGHLQVRHIKQLRQTLGERLKLFTFLRNPVDRVISEYRYCLTPTHPHHEEFQKRYPTLESFVAQGDAAVNSCAYYLTGERTGDPEEVADAMYQTYAFVGLLEMYPISFHIMSAMVWGTAEFPSIHSRRTVDTESNTIVISDDIRHEIELQNALDLVLWTRTRDTLRLWREEALQLVDCAA